MSKELKLKLKLAEQIFTFWEIAKEEDKYAMLRVSRSNSKKNPDGTWENINQNFTCFIFSEKDDKRRTFARSLKGGDKIKMSGDFTFLPEKRAVTGKNGEYQETIFSQFSISVETIERADGVKSETTANDYAKQTGRSNADDFKKDDTTYSKVDDDIPF